LRSPVIQDEEHLLVVLRYIEADPLRASMVADPGDHRWSSFQYHGLGRTDALVIPFPDWGLPRPDDDDGGEPRSARHKAKKS
jgi:putative transposase